MLYGVPVAYCQEKALNRRCSQEINSNHATSSSVTLSKPLFLSLSHFHLQYTTTKLEHLYDPL